MVTWRKGHARLLVLALALSLLLLGPERLSSQEAVAFDLASASWIAGCWRVASPDGSDMAEEQWMSPAGGLMVGMSRSIRNGIATEYELLTLRVEAGRLIYRAMPSGQEPAEFSATIVVNRADLKRLVVTNPGHDFPRRIEYTQEDGHSLSAAVFADIDDEDPAFVVPYQRVKCARRGNSPQSFPIVPDLQSFP
jgi:hypothetical protein